MIPKTIHQIHLGENRLSEKGLAWQQTWREHNPDWEMILWGDEEIKSLNITYPKLIATSRNASEKSDVYRYEILYQHGGLYIDTDFECLKPIDPLFEGKDFLVFRESHELGSAFVAAVKAHPDIKKIIDFQSSRAGLPYPHSFGPRCITECLGIDKGEPDGRSSSSKTVYPYDWREKHRANENFRQTHPEAYAVHHWAKTWA